MGPATICDFVSFSLSEESNLATERNLDAEVDSEKGNDDFGDSVFSIGNLLSKLCADSRYVRTNNGRFTLTFACKIVKKKGNIEKQDKDLSPDSCRLVTTDPSNNSRSLNEGSCIHSEEGNCDDISLIFGEMLKSPPNNRLSGSQQYQGFPTSSQNSSPDRVQEDFFGKPCTELSGNSLFEPRDPEEEMSKLASEGRV